jgi:hypothetical protein
MLTLSIRIERSNKQVANGDLLVTPHTGDTLSQEVRSLGKRMGARDGDVIFAVSAFGYTLSVAAR